MEKFDLIIIGAGPAGLTAAIYAARAGNKVCVVEKGAPGGKLLNSHIFDNYPGTQGASGPELAMKFYQQAEFFGAKFEFEEAVKIDEINDIEKKVVLKSGKVLSTKTILLATGQKSRKLNISEYDKYFGRGIHICVVCDGALYRNKPIAIVGGGYSATEETLFAAKLASKVYILNNQKQLRGEKITLDKIKTLSNVEIINNVNIVKVNGEPKITSVIIEDVNTKEKKEIELFALFTYIGFDPDTNFLDQNILSENKYVDVNNSMETKVKGIFAAGDILNKKVKQVTTATGDATIASFAIDEYLRK